MRNKLYLLLRLTVKDIESRYKGSALGLVWTILTPLLTITVYTIVFSEIFNARWGTSDSKVAFALAMFSGLNAVNMVVETINRSTTLIANNTNYVKKVIFPLRTLPLMLTFSALFNCIIGYIVLFAANLILTGTISSSIWLLPVTLLPLPLISAGLSFLFASISVYLKDLVSFVAILSMIITYTSTVFFSLENVPESLLAVFKLNPMTYVIENVRNVTLYGDGINWGYWVIAMLVGAVLFVCGSKVFLRLKEGFADVL